MSRASSSAPTMNVDLRRRSTGKPDRIEPRRVVDDAAVVAQMALAIDHAALRASRSRGESRSPRRSSGSRRCADRARAASARARASARSARAAPTSASRAPHARPLVERVEQPLHLQIRERELIAQPAREQRAAVADRAQAADDLDASAGERVEIERRVLGRADQLRRRQAARAHEVVDLVVALVPDAGRLHPPEHVAAAVRSRQPHVLADRRASRAGPSGGSRPRAARRSPTRRRRARRRRAAAPGCGSRTA